MSHLYYEYPYQTSFIAEINEIVEKNGMYHIVLDQTFFYPGDTSWHSDTGLIEDSPIHSVYEEEGTIYHVSSKKPIKIHKTKCSINWLNRFHYMQYHLSAHLLTAHLSEAFNILAINPHFNQDLGLLELNQSLSSEQIGNLEQLVNVSINQNIPIECFTPTKSELKKLTFKKPLPKNAHPFPIVQIGDLELYPASGIYPRTTVEAQLVKILKVEKYKQSYRLSFKAGADAINLLSEHAIKTNTQSQSLEKDYQLLQSEVSTLKNIVNEYKAKELIASAPLIGSIRLIRAVYDDLSPKELQSFGNKLVTTPSVIALLGLKTEGTAQLIFMCSKNLKKLSMNTLLKDSITLIDGNGGGTDYSAQGGGKSINNLDSALDYALMQVKKKYESAYIK